MNTSNGWGGLEMNTLKLARLLRDKGFAITLISVNNSTIFQRGEDVFEDYIPLLKRGKFFDLKSAAKINRSLKKSGITTILAFDNKDLDVLRWLKTFYFPSVSIIYQQHMQIGINKKDWLHTYRYKAIDYWISPLEYLKKEVGERTRFPVEKVSVVPIGLDVQKFVQHKYTKTEAREILQLHPSGKLLGIIGRISEKKGQFFAIRAVHELRKQNQNTELLVFGSVTVNDESCVAYYEEMKKYVRDNQLEEVVHFREHHPDVSLFYNSVDVFVLASHAETYGMVTIEAMLSSVPVIATKSGGTSDLLKNGKYGKLFTYESMSEFMSQLQELLNNTTDTAQRVTSALSYAEQNFDLDKETEGIISLLKE